MDFTRNRTWPVFYDYIPVYEIWIQYITVFKRYRPETIFPSEIKGHNSDNNWWILSIIELDLYFMIMYLCMKYESNTPMFSKDIARKPFFVRTGQVVRDVRMYVRTYVRTDVRTRVMLYAPPPHYKWRGHKKPWNVDRRTEWRTGWKQYTPLNFSRETVYPLNYLGGGLILFVY